MNLKLLVLQGKPAGKALLFGSGEYYFGRGPECNVRFNSDWVSRQHCLLRVGPDQATLRDLSSRNGTLINGKLLAEDKLLQQGDQIQIGPIVFEVRLDQPEVTSIPPETGAVIRPADQDSAAGEVPQESTAHHPAIAPTDETKA
jgi:pSer/pThr/pTyr-binding forkhead associated (FHA) protein